MTALLGWHRMRGGRATWAVLAAAAVGGLAACGGGSGSDNGVASKSPDAIIAATRQALTNVKSAHVAGTIASSGQSSSFDLDLLAGRGGRGRMTQGGLRFDILVIGATSYMRGSPAFLRHYGGAAAIARLKGRWMRAKTSTLGTFASLTDLHQLTTALLSGHGKLAIGKRTTIDGQKVIGLDDTTSGGTLFIATTGKPYPIELHKTGADGGNIHFDRFGESVVLAAPANSVDLAKLAGG